MESGGGWVGEASDVGRRGGQRVPAGLVRCTQEEDKRDFLGKKKKRNKWVLQKGIRVFSYSYLTP
jgi:hypothetical protein